MKIANSFGKTICNRQFTILNNNISILFRTSIALALKPLFAVLNDGLRSALPTQIYTKVGKILPACGRLWSALRADVIFSEFRGLISQALHHAN